MDGVASGQLCSLCEAGAAKYTCPRCNVRYCSLECYRSEPHAQCSEVFYKNCCLSELSLKNASDEERQKVMEMLARQQHLNEEEAIPHTDVADLEDRLAGVDMDKEPEEVWSRLTDEEKRHFRECVESGVVSWTPWWSSPPALVEDASSQQGSPLPQLLPASAHEGTEGAVSRASPDLALHVMATLYGYVLMARLHNGQHASLAHDAALVTLSACPVVGSARFSQGLGSVADCVSCCLSWAAQSDCALDRPGLVSLLDDVGRLMRGGGNVTSAPRPDHSALYCRAAVADLHATLMASRAEAEGEMRSQVKRALRKLEFFDAWLVARPGAMVTLLPHLALETERLRLELEEQAELEAAVKHHYSELKPSQPRPLIQEL